MHSKLRFLFIVVLLIAVASAIGAFLENEWFGPSRAYAQSQAACNEIFAVNGWQGYVTTFHYDTRIRITSPDIGDEEIKLLYSLLHEIPRLQFIELYSTSMTVEGIAVMQQEFPDCGFKVHNQWF